MYNSFRSVEIIGREQSGLKSIPEIVCRIKNSLDTALPATNAGKRYQSCRCKKWNSNRRDHRRVAGRLSKSQLFDFWI